MKACTTVLAILGLADASTPAAADDEVVSYRNQTLTIDAVSLGLMAGGRQLEKWNVGDASTPDAIMGVGFVASMAAVPLTHALQGNSGRAVASLALRIGLMNVGLRIGMATDNSCDDFLCGIDNAMVGAFVGITAASIIDNALFPTKIVVRSRTERIIIPQASAAPGRALVGVAGTF